MSKTFEGFVFGALIVASLSACKAPASPPAEPEPEPIAEATPAPAEDPSDVHLEGDHLVIDQKIHFAHDSDEILDDSKEVLDHIAQALGNHAELSTLHVIGHTDASGDDGHNQELSERRAAAVEAALRDRGISQQVDSRGAGESEPLCSEDTDACHEENRRVEFVVEASS